MRDTRAARDIREDGNAIVEFIMMMVVLVIPALYIVVTLASVQAAAFASESSSREAARLLSADPQRTEFASQQAHVIFADFGLPAPAGLIPPRNTASNLPFNDADFRHIHHD